MRSADRSTNLRALAWGVSIMALLAAMAMTRHHLQMMSGSMDDEHLTWWHAFQQEAPHWIFWALALPVVYFFVDRVSQRGWSRPPIVFAHLAFATVMILIAVSVHAFVYDASLGNALMGSVSTAFFTYAAILGCVLAYYYSRRSVEREVELAGAQLRALQAQLRPHFMFNALNSVSMLVRAGRGDEAVEMIARVSALLRDSLDDETQADVPLEEEVALARRYLAVEQVRFADRLAVRVALTEEAKRARVPRLILQPVVENAVRHGIGAKAAAGHVEISASTTGKELVVLVRDDGPGPNGHNGVGGNGVGLKNTRERLETMYGSAARLTLEHGETGGAVATLVVPLR